MASGPAYTTPSPSLHDRVGYRLRIIRVFARTDFKLKYAGSVLGYFWSLAKPLIYFAVLWVVFARVFRSRIPNFGLYLIVGIVYFTYMADAVASALPSMVARGTVLRRLAFPSITVPLGTLASSTATFLLNGVAVAAFVAYAGVAPSVRWLLLVPLILELMLFVAALALIVSSLYVRFRDISQVWEVVAVVMLYSSAIMYPIGILPERAQSVVGLNPLVQILQHSRRALFANDPQTLAHVTVPQTSVFAPFIVLGLFVLGIALHRHEGPRLPELV